MKTKTKPAIDNRLIPSMRLKPMRDPRWQWFLEFAPWGMLIALPVIAWPSNPLRIPGQFLFLAGFTAATLALFAFRVLMRRIAKLFETLWQRGAIAGSEESPGELDNMQEGPAQGHTLLQYQAYIGEVEAKLNGRGQWVTAAFCILLVMTWYLPGFFANFAQKPIMILGLFVEPLVGILIGIMVWRMIIISIQVWQLPKRFDLLLQVGHPDQCGGLEPLGNLCLWNALIIAIAGLFLGGCIALGPSIPPGMEDQLPIGQYLPLFKQLLIFPVVFSFLNFFLPLWSTHQSMVARKAEIESMLDNLTQSIGKEYRELLDSADTMDPSEGEKRLKKLELMSGIYQKNQRIPEWPINISILSKFLASQAIPVLSFLGAADPIIFLVKNLLFFINTGQQ